MEIISCSIIELLQLNNHVKITAVSNQSVSLFSCISPTFGHGHFETGWCEGEDCSSTKGCWPSIHLLENVALPSLMKKKKTFKIIFVCCCTFCKDCFMSYFAMKLFVFFPLLERCTEMQKVLRDKGEMKWIDRHVLSWTLPQELLICNNKNYISHH